MGVVPADVVQSDGGFAVVSWGKFDIDGASGTLAFYADLGQSLGETRFLVDGEGIQLGRSPPSRRAPARASAPAAR